MPQCDKCRNFFPPGFVDCVHPKTGELLKGNFCTFCAIDKDYINYSNGKKITKKELIKEYQTFMKKVRDDNNILKEGAKGMPIRNLEGML